MQSPDETAALLERLLEERAILRMLYEYASAMDTGDQHAWLDCFMPDAVFDVVEVVGGRRVHREEGHDDLASYIAVYPKPPDFRKHVVVHPVIDVDGHRATVEADWLLLERGADGKPMLGAFGRYHDKLLKHDGRWRIAERFAEVESSNYEA